MSSVVEISPLTRVEGHGKVMLHLENGRAERVELRLTESPRLFEALLKGKGFSEVPEIICRICSLCSTIHKVTALLAVERAVGIEVSEQTRLTRELMVYGGQIQSHALHLYCLVLPDHFRAAGIGELAQIAPEALKAGLEIKKAGNLIQETVGGRLIHPVNITVGGLGRRVSSHDLTVMQDALEQILPLCVQGVDLFAAPPPFPRLPQPDYLFVSPEVSPFHGDYLATGEGRLCAVEEYREVITEEVVAGSAAKRARIGERIPTVGAVARLNLQQPLTPLGREAFDRVEEVIIGRDIWGNVPAQAVELIDTVERALRTIERLRDHEEPGKEKVPFSAREGEGSAACEAPRGTLIHSYAFDGNGICVSADVITPTSLNQGAMARDLLALAQAMEGAEDRELVLALERLVRAYDPCISCAVHVLRR